MQSHSCTCISELYTYTKLNADNRTVLVVCVAAVRSHTHTAVYKYDVGSLSHLFVCH